MPFLDPEELKPKLREVFETVVIPQIKKAKMKQTAVEWLFDNLNISGGSDDMKAFEQAKAIEKEQMEEMYEHAMLSLVDGNGHGDGFDEYYTETFKSE